MSLRWEYLVLFLVVGLGTYASRVAPLALMRRRDPGRGVRAVLDYVGPAVLGALLAGALFPEARMPQEPQGWAALAAAIPTWWVARRTGNLGLTVVAGMGLAWLLAGIAGLAGL